MSAYKTGSVTVTVNSPTVIGADTEFDTYVSAGNLFRIRGEDPFYEIAAISSATRLSLTASYQDSDFSASDVLSGMPYQIVTDYTPNYSFPELGSNDINFQNIFTRAIREVDTELFNLEASSITASLGTFNDLTASNLVTSAASITDLTASLGTFNDLTASNLVTSAASITDLTASGIIASELSLTHGFGCNNASPQTSYTVSAPATNLTSVITLCNELRSSLIANGICASG